MFPRHAVVRDLELIARRAAKPHDVPDIRHLRVGEGDQHGPDHRTAVRPLARRAVALDHGRVAAEPGGMPHPAREGPLAGDAEMIPLVHGRRLARRAPGEHGMRILAPDLVSDLGRHVGGGHGAAVALSQAPGGAGVGRAEDRDDPEIGRQVQLVAAQGAGDQHVEEAGVGQRLEERPQQAAVGLDLLGVGADARRELSRLVEQRPTADVGHLHLSTPVLAFMKPYSPLAGRARAARTSGASDRLAGRFRGGRGRCG